MANAYGAQFTVGDYVSIGAMKGRSPERVGQIAKVLGSKDKGDKIAYRLGLADEVFWTSGTGLTDAPAQADAPITVGSLVIVGSEFGDEAYDHSARVAALGANGYAAVQITENDLTGVFLGPVDDLTAASPAIVADAAPAADGEAFEGTATGGCNAPTAFVLGQVDALLAVALESDDWDDAENRIVQAREFITNALATN
jgi:hypothetical protein